MTLGRPRPTAARRRGRLPRQGGRGSGWQRALPWLAAAAVLVALASLALNRSDRILPRVTVDGVPVGGLATDGAAKRLRDLDPVHSIAVSVPGASTVVSSTELGLTLDADASAWAAHQQGRTLHSLLGAVHRDPRVAPAVWLLDLSKAAASLTRLAPLLEAAPQDNSLRLTAAGVEVVPAADGRTVDQAATLLRLQSTAMQVVATGRLDAVTQVIPAGHGNVAAAVAAASEALAHSLDVHAADPIHERTVTLSVPSATWRGWVEPRLDAGGTALEWTAAAGAGPPLPVQLDGLEANHYLDPAEMAPAAAAALAAGTYRLEARIRHAPVVHRVSPGETVASLAEAEGMPYPYLLAANSGLGDNVWPGQEVTVPSLDDLVPLTPVAGKRIVVSLTDQSMQVFENGALKWQWPVSTGVVTSPTAAGVFQVLSHEDNAYASNWKLWMPDFLGIYRPLPGAPFMNGFHGFPTRDGRALLWTGSLGHPATYGCIVMDTENARRLFDWAEDGVMVDIRGRAP